ncbi:FAD-dependent oxidoreductase, partial [Nocardioides sp. GCM10030258]|uniref:FAD-dependent oxidoreductase n=1 Tax=unclassified Nocardioides TaxID=2615069 RepID=UPI00361F2CE5
MAPHLRKQLVVVGHGMVGHRFVQAAIERGLTETYDIIVLGEEPRPAYDRVALTSFFEVGAEALSYLPEGVYDDPRVSLHLESEVVAMDATAQTVTLANGTAFAYDELVLATGAAPFVPPVPGKDLGNVFVYRTIEDLEAIREASMSAKAGAVIGGGLLGLEAANALHQLGVKTHVVEMAPRLMAVQIDEAGGATLKRHVEDLGLTVHTGVMTELIDGDDDGLVSGIKFKDEDTLPLDIVIFSAGIRPRDLIAREAGLDIAERGGVLVDEDCRTSDAHVWAIGECAAPGGRMYGLVAPGYSMAEVVVDQLLGGEGQFLGADMSTKLKLLGVDVASFGDAFATTEDALELVFADAVAGIYKKLVVAENATGGYELLGGILVGDASAYGSLRPMVGSGMELPANPEELILPAGRGGGVELGLPDEAQICSCNNVTKADIKAAVSDDATLNDGGPCSDAGCVTKCTKAGSTCGSCKVVVKK